MHPLLDLAAAVIRHRWVLAAAAWAGGLLVLVVVFLMAPVGLRVFVAIELPVVLAAWTMPKKLVERWLPGKDDDEWPLR